MVTLSSRPDKQINNSVDLSQGFISHAQAFRLTQLQRELILELFSAFEKTNIGAKTRKISDDLKALASVFKFEPIDNHFQQQLVSAIDTYFEDLKSKREIYQHQVSMYPSIIWGSQLKVDIQYTFTSKKITDDSDVIRLTLYIAGKPVEFDEVISG